MQSLLCQAVEIALVIFGSLTMFLLMPGVLGLPVFQRKLAQTLQSRTAKTVLSGLALVTAFVVLEGYQSMNFLEAEAKRFMLAENFPAALRASSSLCAARENFFVAALALATTVVLFRISQLSLFSRVLTKVA